MFSKRKAIKRSPHVCPLMFKMAYAVDGDRAHKKKTTGCLSSSQK